MAERRRPFRAGHLPLDTLVNQGAFVVWHRPAGPATAPWRDRAGVRYSHAEVDRLIASGSPVTLPTPPRACFPLREVLGAALTWVTTTPQPVASILDQHGYGCPVGDRLIRVAVPDDRLPAIVAQVIDPGWDSSRHEFERPYGGPDEVALMVATLAAMNVRVTDTWNGTVGADTAGFRVDVPAHPSLLRARGRYRRRCPEHSSVFCGHVDRHGCGWLADGMAAAVRPAWPHIPAHITAPEVPAP